VQLGFEQTGSDAARRELDPDERRRLQAELQGASEAYVALCRKHGLVRTPEPPTLAEIASTVPAGGVLVLPVLTEHEAFAFVVADGATSPAVIELPRLNRREVVEHLSGEDRWLGIYDTHFRKHRAQDPATAARWHGQLAGTMTWAWERLLAPIHAHLRDVARLKRDASVVLLPPGLLGLLPLHAAGPGPDGRHFDDHWMVTYAPSVRALAACQGRAHACAGQPAVLLAVLDPDSSLPGGRAEAGMLSQRLDRSERAPAVLVGKDATRTAVLEQLPAVTCFHASTHGHHHPIQPMLSGLTMADGELTLEDLRHARLDAARLVFLSACESGLAGVRRLPEEFIGLPAGFVQEGAACVVASLWPIYDHAGYLVAERFYDEWLDAQGRERARPAQALRVAVKWLRRVTFAELKAMFEVEDSDQGAALVLRAESRFLPGSSDHRPAPAPSPDRSRLPSGARLALGRDDERPFAHPQYWAAFTCTGV
jgi:CHAT domain-containing protein